MLIISVLGWKQCSWMVIYYLDSWKRLRRVFINTWKVKKLSQYYTWLSGSYACLRGHCHGPPCWGSGICSAVREWKSYSWWRLFCWKWLYRGKLGGSARACMKHWMCWNIFQQIFVQRSYSFLRYSGLTSIKMISNLKGVKLWYCNYVIISS